MIPALMMRLKFFVWQMHALLFFGLKKISKKQNKKNIIFYPTNGVGLGHITRLLSVATAIKKIDHEVNPIFFTTCPCLYLIRRAGFEVHHISGPNSYTYSSFPSYWYRLMARRLTELYVDYFPEAFVYDGPSPNWGLRFFFTFKNNMKTVWIRRKLRPEHLSRFTKCESWFDEIIEPGESGLGVDNVYPPVMSIEYDSAFSKDEGRRRLNIPDGKKTVYIQLGSDARPLVKNMLKDLEDFFSGSGEFFIVLGVSPLSMKNPGPPVNGMVLQDYPNAKYFKAFDLAISASGYNTFHELLYFGVPTIFIPNEDTVADDQLSRAMRAVDSGAALVVRETLSSECFRLEVACAISRLVQDSEKISLAAKSMVPSNGAEVIARDLLFLLDRSALY